MIDLTFKLAMAVHFFILIWGLLRRERVYEFPFFLTAISAIFILPQAVALKHHPRYLFPESLQTVFLMIAFCIGMGFLGYRLHVNKRILLRFWKSSHVNERRLFHGGIAFVLIGYYFHWRICGLSLDVSMTQWTGVVTIYNFFRNLIYPGFAILLLHFLKRRNVINLLLTLISSFLPLQFIIFAGRREVTAIFLLTIGLSLYFQSGWRPHRWFVIGGLLGAMFVMPLIGIYRDITTNKAWEEIKSINFVDKFYDNLRYGESLELENAAYIIQYASRTHDYQYGADFWNSIIFNFVPAQIVGKDFKEKLMLRSLQDVIDNDIRSTFNYVPTPGLTCTGIADAFLQFGYFGGLFFFFLAYFFKHLWILANQGRNLFVQVFYIQMISPAMLTMTHNISEFPAHFIYHSIFLGFLMLYARSRQSVKFA